MFIQANKFGEIKPNKQDGYYGLYYVLLQQYVNRILVSLAEEMRHGDIMLDFGLVMTIKAEWL